MKKFKEYYRALSHPTSAADFKVWWDAVDYESKQITEQQHRLLRRLATEAYNIAQQRFTGGTYPHFNVYVHPDFIVAVETKHDGIFMDRLARTDLVHMKSGVGWEVERIK